MNIYIYIGIKARSQVLISREMNKNNDIQKQRMEIDRQIDRQMQEYIPEREREPKYVGEKAEIYINQQQNSINSFDQLNQMLVSTLIKATYVYFKESSQFALLLTLITI